MAMIIFRIELLLTFVLAFGSASLNALEDADRHRQFVAFGHVSKGNLPDQVNCHATAKTRAARSATAPRRSDRWEERGKDGASASWKPLIETRAACSSLFMSATIILVLPNRVA